MIEEREAKIEYRARRNLLRQANVVSCHVGTLRLPLDGMSFLAWSIGKAEKSDHGNEKRSPTYTAIYRHEQTLEHKVCSSTPTSLTHMPGRRWNCCRSIRCSGVVSV